MIHWMLDDALTLEKLGRKRSCLCLLLCLVDAYAKNKYPTGGNRKRYCSYLKDNLKLLNLDCNYRIEEKKEMLHLSEIIYEYFRCSIIHEGNDKTNILLEVQLEFEPSGRIFFDSGILIDRVKEIIVIKADWLISILKKILIIEKENSNE